MMFRGGGALCSNEVGEGGEKEVGGLGVRNRRVASERGQTEVRIIVRTSLHSPHTQTGTETKLRY